MPRCLVPFLLAAAAVAAEPAPVVTGELEPLTGVRIGETGLVLGVLSGGYTDRGSFSVAVLRDGPRSVQLSVVRVRRDEGKMVPQPTEVAIPLAELGLRRGDAVRVANPLLVDGR